MSSIDLVSATGLEDWDFDDKLRQVSLYTPKEELVPEELVKRPFHERVKPIGISDNVSEYLVDGLVKVVGPSDRAMAAAQSYWESKKNTEMTNGTLTLLTSFGLGVTSLAVMSLPAFAVTCAVGFLATAVFSGLAFASASKAKGQIEKWSAHPAKTVADMRTEAYARGFFYSMARHLKGSYENNSVNGVLHPSEITKLYEKAFQNRMDEILILSQRSNLSDREKLQWTQRFASEKILSKEAISYAYFAKDPKREILELFAHNFEAFCQDARVKEREYASQRQKIDDEAHEIFSQIENERANALAGPLLLKRSADKQAWELRQEKLDRLEEGSSIERKREIKKEYESKISSNQEIYNFAASAINLPYDNRKKEIERWKENALQELDREKEIVMASLFDGGLDLFTAAYSAWEGNLELSAEAGA